MLQAKLTSAEASHRQAQEQLVRARIDGEREHQASARSTKICTALQERLLELEAVLRQTEQERAADAAAAVDRLTQRHAEFTASLAHAARSRDTLAQQLNVARTELEEARQAREADANAAADHRRTCQAEFETALAATAGLLAAAEQQVESLRAALQQTEARHASERAAEAERAATRDAETAATVAQISDERSALARQLSTTSAALDESQAQRSREQGDARETLEQTVAQAAATAASLAAAEQQVESVRAALQQAEARHASERAAREAETAAILAQVTGERETLSRKLNDASAALEESHAQRAQQQRDAEETLEHTLAQAAATRESFERQLADAANALERAEDTRAADAVAAAQTLAARDEEAAATVAQLSADRDALSRQLSDASAALEESYAQRAQQQRDAEETLEHTLAQAAATRESFERQLADAADALERAEETRAADAIAAARHLAAREAELGAMLAEGVTTRSALEARFETELNETRAESARARRRLLTAASALRRRTVEHKARQDAQFAAERAGHERRLGAREETIQQLELERDTLRQSLDATRGQLQELSDIYDRERQDSERALSAGESDRQRLSADLDQTRQSLDHLRDAFNTLERVSSEHALERSRLESVVADRDAQMSAQESAHAAAEQAGREALRQVEAVLDASRQESRWQFEHATVATCRVTRDGTLAGANRAFANLLGSRSADNLAKLDFSAVFEAPADLHWLIERAVTGAALQPIEAVWKKRDGTRLTVRLQVARTKETWIELAADDITSLRATEEDLRHARRMEAVGRLASEVAVTCDTLLRGVSQAGQHWLAAMGSDRGLRHQGERLLNDVAHATSLLQRLAAYSNEQVDALEPVNLRRVLRNLAPVLKRVAGEDIEVVLPKNIPPFSVDVERPRVERVLVNVASYARERMPHGGRLKIDLATTVVDRPFLDKYPNVRPGRHVIATVTEERGPAAHPDLWPNQSIDDSAKPAGDKRGVDLSALLQLLGDSGGHLWVTAEPPGNMTLKIHLPMRAADRATRPAPQQAQPDGVRAPGRWFR
jgi:chromosome segregation ATPase